MDSLITAAARALAAGDALGALKRVALREDPPALALRGIALAQLGELPRARVLLRAAARAFGAREAVARARCVVAEAEIALASRDLSGSASTVRGARAVLVAHGDHHNATHAALIEARRWLLIGELDEATRVLAAITKRPQPPALVAVHHLLRAGVALRRVHTRVAARALDQAEAAARAAGIPALLAEVEAARGALEAPAGRAIESGEVRSLRLAEVEALLASDALVIDACRYVVSHREARVSLATRPVLFALARALAEAWPQDVPRDVLIAHAFGARVVNDSHRARLRVELGRVRAMLRAHVRIEATARGYALVARDARDVVVLARPVETPHASVLALLADGEAWSSSALALALGTSQRTAQRALESLLAAGQVRAVGAGRSRRWTSPPLVGFTTTLLLPGPPLSG